MEFGKLKRAYYLASAAIALTACNPDKRALPIVTPIAVPFFQSPEIDQFYPELKGIVPTDHGVIETNDTSTEWFNYSERRFNSTAAHEALVYFERLSRSNEVIQYRFSDVVMQISIEPRPKTGRLIFIVSGSRPLPKWITPPYSTATRLYFDTPSEKAIPSITVVTALDRGKRETGTRFGTPAALNTHNFLVEACQSSLRIRTDNPNFETFGQEIICNSLGLSTSLKSQKASYQEYKDWARNVAIIDHNNVPQPFYMLSENQYTDIPIFVNIIS